MVDASEVAWTPIFFRTNSSEAAVCGGNYSYPCKEEAEKRRLFLQSYQFCRKRTIAERIGGSFFRVKRFVCVGLRAGKKIRKLLRLIRFRYGIFSSTRRRRRRRRFARLHHTTTTTCNGKKRFSSRFSCLW